jgi:hypothetical protein
MLALPTGAEHLQPLVPLRLLVEALVATVVTHPRHLTVGVEPHLISLVQALTTVRMVLLEETNTTAARRTFLVVAVVAEPVVSVEMRKTDLAVQRVASSSHIRSGNERCQEWLVGIAEAIAGYHCPLYKWDSVEEISND